MKITTPHGTLEGDNIEAILKEHGFDCLHGADLSSTDLSDANLRYANLSDANLRDAYDVQLSIAKTSILPDEGDIIGWKKAWTDNETPLTPVIVKLLIPSDALRSNATGRKCRASTARVLDLQDKQGNSLPSDTTAYSSYDADFTYKKAKPSTSKTSTPTGGTNALQASTSSSPASKQSNTKEAPNEQ